MGGRSKGTITGIVLSIGNSNSAPSYSDGPVSTELCFESRVPTHLFATEVAIASSG